MNFYPFTSAIVLTDAIFSTYGGHFGMSTDAQRDVAYWISERQACEDLETFFQPTIVTGSYLFNPKEKFLILDHAYVSKIIKTSFIDVDETVYWSQLGTANVYISLRDDVRGLVDIHYLVGNCHCRSSIDFPYKIQEVYETGLPTAIANSQDILLGLTTYADIILNEIIGYGNESSGDIGVQSFTNQQYSEQRVKLLHTSWGSSARAQFVKKLFEKYRRRRYVGLM